MHNMLHLRPIIVNNDMEIIDGQHRLAAAKLLKLEVPYKVDENSSEKDVILLNNNQKSWTLEDYLNFYINQGNEEYKKLKEFKDNYGFEDLSSNLLLLGQHGGNYRESFKSGNFVMAKHLFVVKLKLEFIQATVDLINRSKVHKDDYFKRAKFLRALIMLSKKPKFDEKIFLRKLGNKLQSVHACMKVEEYYEMLKNIFNYKNMNPIE